jgi:hypothetical protein
MPPDPQNPQAPPITPENYVAPGTKMLNAAGDALQGTKLQKAYDAAKSWLGEHEDKIDEQYLKPFRQGLDNMADDLQSAAESGHTQGGVPLTGPTKALTEAAAAGLRMVPIGKTVKDTAAAVIAPPELNESALAKNLVEGEGLIYKGEVSPGTGIHMIEHPDHPGITSTFRGEMTPENVHANMERKVKEFGKEYVKPNENKTVYRARAVGEEGVKSGNRPVATDSPEKAKEYAKNLESMTGKPHEVVEIPLKGTTHTKHPLPDSKDTWYSFQKDVPEGSIKAPKKSAAPETPKAAPASQKSSSQTDKVKKQANEKGSKDL